MLIRSKFHLKLHSLPCKDAELDSGLTFCPLHSHHNPSSVPLGWYHINRAESFKQNAFLYFFALKYFSIHLFFKNALNVSEDITEHQIKNNFKSILSVWFMKFCLHKNANHTITNKYLFKTYHCKYTIDHVF